MSATNHRRRTGGTERREVVGLVRRDSDLTSTVESDDVSASRADGISPGDDSVGSGSLRRGLGLRSPSAAVRGRNGATSGRISSERSVAGHSENAVSPKSLQFSGKATRSSAIAEGPRDASCQLKSCQLPCNSAETTCMTSPEPSISCR